MTNLDDLNDALAATILFEQVQKTQDLVWAMGGLPTHNAIAVFSVIDNESGQLESKPYIMTLGRENENLPAWLDRCRTTSPPLLSPHTTLVGMSVANQIQAAHSDDDEDKFDVTRVVGTTTCREASFNVLVPVKIEGVWETQVTAAEREEVYCEGVLKFIAAVYKTLFDDDPNMILALEDGDGLSD